MAKKFKSKTLSTYKKLKHGNRALKVGVIATPLLPASIITGINWNEWFAQSGFSLPLGLGSLLVTTLLAILCLVKSDTVIKKKDTALIFLACLFLCLGVTNLFLASLFTQLGYMFIYTACGLAGSFGEYEVSKRIMDPKIEEYKKLVEENCLDTKSQKRKERKEQALRDREELAKQEAENIENGGLI